MCEACGTVPGISKLSQQGLILGLLSSDVRPLTNRGGVPSEMLASIGFTTPQLLQHLQVLPKCTCGWLSLSRSEMSQTPAQTCDWSNSWPCSAWKWLPLASGKTAEPWRAVLFEILSSSFCHPFGARLSGRVRSLVLPGQCLVPSQ